MKFFALILVSIFCAVTESAVTVKPTVKPLTLPTVKPPTLPTVKPPTIAPPTLPPFNKDELLKNAAALQTQAATLIDKLTSGNRASMTSELKRLTATVKSIAEELQATTAATGPNTLLFLETELYWFNRRMDIEFQVVQAAEQMLDVLLTMADKLSAKIDVAVKNLAGTPMGDVMQQEGDALNTVMSDLKTAKNTDAIEKAGRDLAKIEDRVEKELKAFNIPPM